MADATPYFGRYRLVRPISDCDRGRAYFAKRIGADGFEKDVALWHLHDAETTYSLDDAIEEAKQAALLSHANVAHVLDLGLVGGACFVVTEWVGDTTLANVVRRTGTLPWHVAARIVKDAASALRYVHQRRAPNGELLRLVHRRISMRRLALSDFGAVKVTGFGTSRAWRLRGVPRAPEWDRDEPVDGRADVFALAKILETCLGPQDVPAEVRVAIERATHPYQEHRSTARELEDALATILHRRGHECASESLAPLARACAPPVALGAFG